ncbi:MAG: thioredoxin [Clostridia bacterium]|nr:thioredoxin [Clostridia bacterium]
MVKHINGKELENLLASEQRTIFCDFWASWCGPCRMLAPVFEEISNAYDGQALFVKVDVDDEESASVAIKYQITSIPNVIAFKGGVPKDSSLGFVPQQALETFVKNNL